MFAGVMFALTAGLMWGLIFVGPLLVPDYPGTLQSAGRYVAFGLIALPLAWHDRQRLRKLASADWREALKLSLVGNLLYYAFLASAIQRTGAPVSTMIIGTLPVVIAVTANWRYGHLEGRLSWRRLIPALIVIAAGLLCVNVAELHGKEAGFAFGRYLTGIALAIMAVVCWTWYPLRNARWLRTHPQLRPSTWATAQGVVTLPLALIMYGFVSVQLTWQRPDFDLPFGPHPGVFVPLMLTIGLLCSWLGTLCWNAASQRLPTVLMGPLIVFEILFGLLWTFLWRQSWPPLLTITGIFCLMVGVIWAMRIKPEAQVAEIKI
ncbi:MAG: DMT family transporter [Enterobacterales bacterium endosymbiont of Blomia tropicalis]|uniref:DMT family transporter n=1 Tax=Mixta mediterraneensis TaxID=2758443 RepID=UPI0018761251|nr:DMT family transporter [Mixta mediterraneensis]MBE5253441.1 DMT family transporter [Mixta mediterraneensis]MDL4914765.1 DMT family transporter [Mixta mediterraneensis]